MTKVKEVLADPKARVIALRRTQKKRYATVAEQHIEAITTRRREAYEIYLADV